MKLKGRSKLEEELAGIDTALIKTHVCMHEIVKQLKKSNEITFQVDVFLSRMLTIPLTFILIRCDDDM